MPIKENFTEPQKGSTIRIPPDLWQKLLTISDRIAGTTPSSLGVDMIRDIITLTETPEPERTIPKTVTTIDAVNQAASRLLKLGKEKTK